MEATAGLRFRHLLGARVPPRLIAGVGRDRAMTGPDSRRSKKTIKWLFGCLILLLLAVGILAWYNANLNAQHMAGRIEERVETTVDPAVLQSWAVKQINRNGSSEPMERLPGLDEASLRERPQVGLFRHGDTNFVLVSWGAGTLRSDCRWGLAIGSPTFVVPQYRGWKIRQWKPGVYFWQDFQRVIEPRTARDIEG